MGWASRLPSFVQFCIAPYVGMFFIYFCACCIRFGLLACASWSAGGLLAPLTRTLYNNVVCLPRRLHRRARLFYTHTISLISLRYTSNVAAVGVGVGAKRGQRTTYRDGSISDAMFLSCHSLISFLFCVSWVQEVLVFPTLESGGVGTQV